MNKEKMKSLANGLVIGVLGLLAASGAVWAFSGVAQNVAESGGTINVYNEGGDESLGGTRYPNGISADGTAANAGQVRGTTLTVTGATTLNNDTIISANLDVAGQFNVSSTAIIDGNIRTNADITVSTTAFVFDAYLDADLGGALGINTTSLSGELDVWGGSATSSISLDTDGTQGSCLRLIDAGNSTVTYLTVVLGNLTTSTTDCR